MIFYSDDKGTLYNGDVREVIKELPDQSVDCIVTSPPYWGLRDYGNINQIGNEPIFIAYIARLCDLFAECGRVLKDSGTMWINLGDTYYSKNKGDGGHSKKQDSNKGSWYKLKLVGDELPEKSLSMIPARFAIEMQNRGWILRNDIIWAKPNPMPESVKDRLTKSHEHIFLFAKNKNYYFDNLAIAEPAVWTSDRLEHERGFAQKEEGTGLHPQHHGNRMSGKVIGQTQDGHKGAINANGTVRSTLKEGQPIRNKRDVWFITPKAFKGAHFATFPKDLIEPCILAGCPENGKVLDPFFGAGTTGLVSEELNRKWIGIELNEKYCDMAINRILGERNGN